MSDSNIALDDIRVLLIIPAYNEADSIERTIEDVKANAPFADYLIIDDGSIDSTAKICELNGFNYLTLPVNLGLSGAFQTGIMYALENGYDYAIQFDGDGQHLAKYVGPMVETAVDQNADVVIGSRFILNRKLNRGSFSARMLGSVLITRMILYTTGARISDPTSGMRLFNRKMMGAFAAEADLSPEPDSIAHLARSGAKITEVPVEMRERAAGESYLSLSKSITYMLRVCISILFVQWFRKRAS